MSNSKMIQLNNISGLDLVCFSHLRWDFVYQRPQHLMKRFGKFFRIFFIQEPVFHDTDDILEVKITDNMVQVITPHLNQNDQGSHSIVKRQKQLLNEFFEKKKIERFIAWYYTPMALKISSHLNPEIVVYDCMDELSAFKFAPAELKIMEAELFSKAHLVFTGGHSLFEAKKNAHHNIYSFPSSIDKEHFSQGRKSLIDPDDQKIIPRLRFGFYGVIDERFNINMIKEIAEKRPDWQLVLIGPVVKINPDDLPRNKNIHYLGSKSYSELPIYLAGWDFAMIPFEKNESTRFISPTKTPEYLSAGKPVISTSITDVVSPYGKKKLVYIADTADEFIKCAEEELNRNENQQQRWLKKVDVFLKDISWDFTAMQMMDRMSESILPMSNTGQERSMKSVA